MPPSDPSLRLQPGVLSLGHSDDVWSVAFSHDGQSALSGAADGTLHLWDVASGRFLRIFEGHTGGVYSVAFSPDEQRALSGAKDGTLRLWDVASGQVLRVFVGHTANVCSVAFSPDGARALSGATDGTLHLWDVASGQFLLIFEDDKGGVWSVAFSPDGARALSGHEDGTIHLWDVASGQLLLVFVGHTGTIFSVAFSPDGQRAISGAEDGTLHLWDVASGQSLRIFEGHTDGVWSVALSPDGERALSGDEDGTIRLWDVASGQLLRVFEGHPGPVYSVAFSPDGQHLLSAASNGELRIWEANDQAAAARAAAEQQQVYKIAKVLLMGDSGVGKSGLAERLLHDHFVATESTHARQVEVFSRRVATTPDGREIQHEIVLWDLAGQPEYRLVHQLSLDNATVACVLIDNSRPTAPLEGATYWAQALEQLRSTPAVQKILVASRIDVGGLPTTEAELQQFVGAHGFAHYVATSAKTGEGCTTLAQLIEDHIPWDHLTELSTNRTLDALRTYLAQRRGADSERRTRRQAPVRLCTIAELHADFTASFDGPLSLPEFTGWLRRLEFSDDVKLLYFRTPGAEAQPIDQVLLDPTRIDAYASALLMAARDQPHGPGHLPEARIIAGDFRLDDAERLPGRVGEEHVLWFVLEYLLRGELALRERIGADDYIVFPSQCTTEFPFPGAAAFGLAFGFAGSVRNLYATLIAQLAHYEGFQHQQKPEFFQDAAVYHTTTGRCILRLRDMGTGKGELDVLFDPTTPVVLRQGFIEFVGGHLQSHAVPGSISRRYAYQCPHCKEYEFEDHIVRRRLEAGKQDLNCPNCDKTSPLLDLQTAPTPDTTSVAKQMRKDAAEGKAQMTADLIIKAKEAEGIYDVFLSHNSRDKAVVEDIARQLRKEGIRPWLDKWELAGGDMLMDSLEQALHKCSCIALCIGPAGISKWHLKEIRAALDKNTANEVRLLPIILPGYAEGEEPEVPLFLRQPLWVDLRQWKQGDDDAFYRLLCGIEGKAPGPR